MSGHEIIMSEKSEEGEYGQYQITPSKSSPGEYGLTPTKV